MNGNELRSEDSLQPVKYLGKARSLYAHGVGVAMEPVRIVWTRSKKGSRYNRCALSVHPFGLCIYEEIASGTFKSVWSDAIENISYCVAEPLHRRIFAWIARSPRSNELECHVVLCKTSKRSRILAELLAKAFHDSFRYRQQQLQALESSSASLSARCSVCDTIARHQHQQQNNNRHQQQQQQQQQQHNSVRSRSHHGFYDDDDDERHPRQVHNDYERVSFRSPVIARAFVRNYEQHSMTSSSRRSVDNDTTLADEESIKPVEYFRG